MAKIGRNDPCPCGSGKKHKRCCLNPEPMPPEAKNASDLGDDELCDCCVDALNDRADRALDLILGGHLDEAEAMANDLMKDFPQEVEGIDLLSMVSEARGQRERAAELLRRAIDVVRVHPYHEAETRVLMRQRLRELQQRA